MKSLKASDQSSGWWRVGGGFLSGGEMGPMSREIRGDSGRREIQTINHCRRPEEFLGGVRNVEPELQKNAVKASTAELISCNSSFGIVVVPGSC